MSTPTFIPLFIFLFASLSCFVAGQGQGTTKCVDTGLDWYTGKVGETPCKTYERLRQICNNNFRVGVMNPNTPPDFCNEQIPDCCCNNVAFSLAMLCLTCQRGLGSAGSGIDAGVGAYQIYLTGDRNNEFCHPQTNHSLPADIQSAVCNQKINIYDDLYEIMWADGQWFYIWTSQEITKNQAAHPDKMFTKCPQTLASNSPSISTSATSTSPSSSTSSTSDSGPRPSAAGENSSSNTSSSSMSQSSSTSPIPTTSGTGANIIGANSNLNTSSQSVSTSATSSGDGSSPTKIGANSNPNTSSDSKHPHSLSSGAIAGIAVGIAVAVVVVVLALLCWRKKWFRLASIEASVKVPTPQPYTYTKAGASEYNTTSSGYSQPLTGIYASSLPEEVGMARNIPFQTDSGEMSERHVDAGPVGVMDLRRNPSGRLPPAYGDLIRDG